jgi:hypothetical protein
MRLTKRDCYSIITAFQQIRTPNTRRDLTKSEIADQNATVSTKIQNTINRPRDPNLGRPPASCAATLEMIDLMRSIVSSLDQNF